MAVMACGPKEADPTGNNSSAAPAAASSNLINAGAGLKGLTPLPKSMFLDPKETGALMALAYPDQPASSIIVRRDDVALNAEPVGAIRLTNEIALIVNHRSVQECHACAGATSIFYFSSDGKQLLRSYPLKLNGTGWGEGNNLQAMLLPGNEVAMLSKGGWAGQGFICEWMGVVRISPGEPQDVATIPTFYDNTNANGGTVIKMRGMEAGKPGTITVKWQGTENGDDGAPKPVDITHDVTLDGVEEPWMANWTYSC